MLKLALALRKRNLDKLSTVTEIVSNFLSLVFKSPTQIQVCYMCFFFFLSFFEVLSGSDLLTDILELIAKTFLQELDSKWHLLTRFQVQPQDCLCIWLLLQALPQNITSTSRDYIHDAFLLLVLTLMNFYGHRCFSSPPVLPPAPSLPACLPSFLIPSIPEVESGMKNDFKVISCRGVHRKRKLQEIEWDKKLVERCGTSGGEIFEEWSAVLHIALYLVFIQPITHNVCSLYFIIKVIGQCLEVGEIIKGKESCVLVSDQHWTSWI